MFQILNELNRCVGRLATFAEQSGIEQLREDGPRALELIGDLITELSRQSRDRRPAPSGQPRT
jgi:hypothetical protein